MKINILKKFRQQYSYIWCKLPNKSPELWVVDNEKMEPVDYGSFRDLDGWMWYYVQKHFYGKGWRIWRKKGINAKI